MSWAPVDFSLVRYSPVENTHFFYDENHPSSIQFLLSGRWESWDVGYVGYKARDPTIRQIAKEAETRLANDPQSGYRPWPSEPPPGSPAVPSNGQPEPGQVNRTETPIADLVDFLVPLSPTPESEQTAKQSAALTPQDAGPNGSYTSPYRQPKPTAYSAPQPTNNATPIKGALPSVPNVPGAEKQPQPPPHGQPQPTAYPTPKETGSTATFVPETPVIEQKFQPPSGPALASAAPRKVALSRRRETKILLSIDGDGVRGLSSLLLIESLVNAICVKIGQRLDPHQIFDLTGGSSLGGVIALLLCRLQMQAHRAREAYKKISRQVYLNKRDFYISLDPHLPLPHRDGTALENEISQVIQQELAIPDERLFDDREDSGDVFVVSTHIEIGINKAALMRSYQTRRITGPELDANMTIAQAMKATAVAPRYIQSGANSRLVIEPGLVDHGTAKNNPVRDILYECRKLFRYANDMMIIISIGTGIGLNRENEIAEMANGVEDRNSEARSWGEKFEADHQALMQRGWMKYFRFNVPGLEDVPLEEWCHEDAIKEKTSAYLAQPEVAHMFYACVDAIVKLLLGPSQ